MSRSRNPPQKGQGAARAKQMGLLLDLSPDAGMEQSGGNEEDLEAELFALIGGERGGGRGGAQGKKADGKAPVHMDDIERMAALCMKDLDEEGDDDADLENDADLLAELNDVLDDDNEAPAPVRTPPQRSNVTPKSTPTTPSGAGGLESLLQERIDMYQTAITNAKASGEASKARRYDRGLKTLQTMLTSAKKGKPVNEEEIPPPVATGAKPNPAHQEPIREEPAPPKTNEKPVHEMKPVAPPKSQLLQPTNQRTSAVTPDTPAISPLTPVQPSDHHSELKASVLNRQREYKLAAIQAKQSGNTDLARQHLVVAKKLDSVVEAIDRGEKVDAGSLPPPPGDVVVERSPPPPHPASSKPTPAPPPAAAPPPEASLPAPRNLGEALQQRMDKYKSAAEIAKSKGDERKARMHQRIAKQYQDAIKAHKAGRPVNLAELPVPPGCPPLQGGESSDQNFLGVLETAVKLANQDADAGDDDDDDDDGDGEVAKPAVRPAAQKARASVPSHTHTPSPAVTPPASTDTSKMGPRAQQQLDFLLRRRQQFVKAALRSKQMKDVQGAAQHLRNAKGLDPMITAAKGGLPVDISKVPSAPVTEEDYALSNSRSSSHPSRLSQQYVQLMERLRQQHEKCLNYLQQFTQMGNMAETLRFEKLADECMSNIEVLKKAHAKGYPVPGHHTEERTINTVKIFPNLTASEMELTIYKGINLPTPGFSANDLDASVRFEFPFPSSEEAQRDKTNTVKSTNCPEFRAQFKLHINRTHRSFKRVVQTKGIRFEIIHKGGLFKNDKIVGSAQLKLDALENLCEVREIIEVLDGRKATGGKLEVRVRIREPLGGVQLQSVTEKWIVLDPPAAVTPEREKTKERVRAPSPKSKPRNDQGKSSQSSLSPPPYKLHSFSLLNHDKDRLEWKIGEYKRNRRDPPADLLNQHKEICHRLHWQKSYLEKGSSAALTDYDSVLNRFACGLSDSVKKFSNEGNREAAKEALGRLKMVEAEMESLRRKRAA